MNRPESPGEAPRAEAVALAYTAGQAAPTVVAKGRGLLAETIIEKAKEAGLFVHESPELVSLLMQVDLDKSIPAELYQAVAEILAFVYYLERQAKGSSQNVDDLLAQAGQALTLPLPVALPAAADSATPATPPTPR